MIQLVYRKLPENVHPTADSCGDIAAAHAGQQAVLRGQETPTDLDNNSARGDLNPPASTIVNTVFEQEATGDYGNTSLL